MAYPTQAKLRLELAKRRPSKSGLSTEVLFEKSLERWPTRLTKVGTLETPQFKLLARGDTIERLGHRVRRLHVRIEALKRMAHLALRRSLLLPETFTSAFCPYNDVACGYPLDVSPEERWRLFGADPAYYKQFKDTGQIMGKVWDFADTLSGTYADIAPHGGLDLFCAPSERRVLGVLTRGGMDPMLRESGPAVPQWSQTDAANDLREGEVVEFSCEIIEYESVGSRFWWHEGMEYSQATGKYQQLFRMGTDHLTYKQGDWVDLAVLGRKGFSLKARLERISDASLTPKAPPEFGQVSLPVGEQVWHETWVPVDKVTHFLLPTDKLSTGVYRVTVASEHTHRNCIFIVRPARPEGRILYVCATNQWRSYAFNAHYHTYLPKSYPWSYCYSSQLMEGISGIYDDVSHHSRYPMQPRYYNNMPTGFGMTCLGFVQTLESFRQEYGWDVDYCGEEDVHFGRVDLGNYQTVFLDNHAEYSTWQEMDALQNYLDSGKGWLIVLGGDAFGRLVHYTVGDNETILYQNLHNSNCEHFPGGAQFTDQQRCERFGICVSHGFGARPMHPLTVVDDAHPITRDWKAGEVLSLSSWESDDVWPAEDWHLLVRFTDIPTPLRFDDGSKPDCHTTGLALHRNKKLISMGPMGLAETLVNYYGNYGNVRKLLENTVRFCIG